MRAEEARALVAGGAPNFYKVPFEEVPELVARRKVHVSRGAAYVPREHLAVLVIGHFRARLSKVRGRNRRACI